MAGFSQESTFLIQNWDTIQDMLSAIEGLRRELSKALLSLKPELEQRNWWNEDWAFLEKAGQVYISHKQWQIASDYALWIGLEKFTPENILGSATPPTLYVWVTGAGRHRGLDETITHRIRESGKPILGQLNGNRSNGYVVTQCLKKCLPEDVDTYLNMALTQAISFIEYYAVLFSNATMECS